jgi:hypothetical protein
VIADIGRSRSASRRRCGAEQSVLPRDYERSSVVSQRLDVPICAGLAGGPVEWYVRCYGDEAMVRFSVISCTDAGVREIMNK